MFKINEHRLVNSDLPIITGNYLKLLSDENPIIYTGTNDYGNRVLGIIVEESDEDYSIRYFHLIIDDKTYYKFINKKITLRGVFEKSNIVFVVDFKGDQVKNKYLIPVEEIPVGYLPLDDSYCPDVVSLPSFNFGVSLKGKKSELHLVDVSEANQMQTAFEKILQDACLILQETLTLRPKTYLEPSEIGSFRVNYKIEFENSQASLFQLDNKLIAEYISSYLHYIIAKLPYEDNNVLKEENISSIPFKEVEEKLVQLFNNSHHTFSTSDVEHRLVENINESALKFEDITNQIIRSTSFDKIELVNYQLTGGEFGLGMIDKTFFNSIKPKLIIKEPEVSTDIITRDISPQKYRVRVFKFNTVSGNCGAYFYPDESETHFPISININKGDKEYSHSIFSKSLDEEKVIDIIGIGEKKNGNINRIFVDL